MSNNEFEILAKRAVVNYYNGHVEKTDNVIIGEDDVYVVWMCKILGNNKALISTVISDGMYYEVTFNGEKDEIYLDAYKKWENVCILAGLLKK